MKTNEDERYIYYFDSFQGMPIRILQDKETGEILFNADDVARALDLGADLNEFLGSDEGLDCINAFKKAYPGTEIFGRNGIFREIQGEIRNY